jgi:gamma-glutamylcyclotransferase (GGCT)/AIG2-like uncharacterized protein YtfP
MPELSHDFSIKSTPDRVMSELVAVYGTLKRGMANSELLRDARFLGQEVLTGIVLYDLGPYPGARAEPSEGIEVEVFEVNELQLQLLDLLEDYVAGAPESGMYDRRRFMTSFGPAWVYLYNLSVAGLRVQRCGSWQPVQELHSE